LPIVLNAIKAQTLKPTQTIVVNDGSEDDTSDIARGFGCIVLDLPRHDDSWSASPKLVRIFNEGLSYLKDDLYYVMILGADHVLQPNYAEAIIDRMDRNPRLAISSGIINGEIEKLLYPRGSGRVIRLNFWCKIGLCYPEFYGWESWLIFKALQMGYDIKVFYDISSRVLRPTKIVKKYYGRAMRALGYWAPYALGRCFIMFLKRPKSAIQMFFDWLIHYDVERLDISDWVTKYQKKVFLKRVSKVVGL